MKLIVTLPAAAPAHPTLTTCNPCCPANQLPTLGVPPSALVKQTQGIRCAKHHPTRSSTKFQPSAQPQDTCRRCKHTSACIHKLELEVALLCCSRFTQHTWCCAACNITEQHTPPSHQQQQTAADCCMFTAEPRALPCPGAAAFAPGNRQHAHNSVHFTAPLPGLGMLRCSFHQTTCLQHTLCIGLTSTFCVLGHQQSQTPPCSPSHLHPRQLTHPTLLPTLYTHPPGALSKTNHICIHQLLLLLM
jgi:hypothetical protein